MQPEISCQHVRKVFGKGSGAFEAVTVATFSIEKGEFVCLLGLGGCGQHAVDDDRRLEPVTDGRILPAAPHDEPRADIGIVFQDRPLALKTTLQNILFPSR
jgi:ABC-type nitrate/sulfonate/bicarbonate transport system ATPase subunit